MTYFTRYKTNDIRGFTLVETLVSVFIITIVIVGPLTLASSASSYAKLTKDTITATYLAQESIELLRFHQDSMYIRCADQNSQTCSLQNGETPNEAAWRLFKARLQSNPSCITYDMNGTLINADGCSYDFIDMATEGGVAPTKYLSTSASCNTLSLDAASGVYVCTGVRGAGLQPTVFSRTVKITSVSTLGGADAAYNDDLRVTVTVTFKKPNGYTHQVKVIDFLHARA